MEGQALQMAHRGSNFAMVGSVRRQYRCVTGHESMAPQDAAQEIQIRCSGDSHRTADNRRSHYLFSLVLGLAVSGLMVKKCGQLHFFLCISKKSTTFAAFFGCEKLKNDITYCRIAVFALQN